MKLNSGLRLQAPVDDEAFENKEKDGDGFQQLVGHKPPRGSRKGGRGIPSPALRLLLLNDEQWRSLDICSGQPAPLDPDLPGHPPDWPKRQSSSTSASQRSRTPPEPSGKWKVPSSTRSTRRASLAPSRPSTPTSTSNWPPTGKGTRRSSPTWYPLAASRQRTQCHCTISKGQNRWLIYFINGYLVQ